MAVTDNDTPDPRPLLFRSNEPVLPVFPLGRIVSGRAAAEMDQFIARENVKHFRDLLWSENDPDERSRLQKLLVEEEDKLAKDFELLADIDRHILDGARRMERQRAIISTMERKGSESLPRARALLDGMIDGQLLHIKYRGQIVVSIERNRL